MKRFFSFAIAVSLLVFSACSLFESTPRQLAMTTSIDQNTDLYENYFYNFSVEIPKELCANYCGEFPNDFCERVTPFSLVNENQYFYFGNDVYLYSFGEPLNEEGNSCKYVGFRDSVEKGKEQWDLVLGKISDEEGLNEFIDAEMGEECMFGKYLDIQEKETRRFLVDSECSDESDECIEDFLSCAGVAGYYNAELEVAAIWSERWTKSGGAGPGLYVKGENGEIIDLEFGIRHSFEFKELE